jgi:hypothetical protein
MAPFKPTPAADDNVREGQRLSELIRDPRYTLPLAMLVAVIIISAAMGAGPGAVDSAVPSLPYVPRQDAAAPTASPELVRDYARASDLGALREAALASYRRTGAFSDTRGGVVELCSEPAGTACALLEARGLPSDDGTHPYYYASDGLTYAVFIARAEVQGDETPCPAALPPDLANTALICVRVEPMP